MGIPADSGSRAAASREWGSAPARQGRLTTKAWTCPRQGTSPYPLVAAVSCSLALGKSFEQPLAAPL
eukprot:8128505-Pyramimonas_sp.AAC.1